LHLINLLKQTEKTKGEGHLAERFNKTLEKLNADIPGEYKIEYSQFDMKEWLKTDKEGFISEIKRLGIESLSKQELFCSTFDPSKKLYYPKSFQVGVIRTNCLDCLDRTNFFQEIIGETVLSLQIESICEHLAIYNDNDFIGDSLAPKLVQLFQQAYQRMGDALSLQYAGSVAQKQDSSSLSRISSSMMRYFRSNFSDLEKQNAFNLFLGVYKPEVYWHEIWESETDDKSNSSLELQDESLDQERWWEEPLKDFKRTCTLKLSQKSPTSSSILRYMSDQDIIPEIMVDEKGINIVSDYIPNNY
jgi:hypothetical protein